MPESALHRIDRHFPFVADDGHMTPLEVTEHFFEDLGRGAFGDLGSGLLVSTFAFEADWDVWEVHPAGDELVILLEGAADLVLDARSDSDDGVGPVGQEPERVVMLREPGEFVVVPRGTWHTARTDRPTRALFVTRGDGTDHRPA